MPSVGARATAISFADTMSRLADGSINAVLSSGDGGTGRKLWQYLPYFSEITYSLPISVASVNQAVYDGLSPELREAVDEAGRKTEIELWLALSTRLEENYQRMRGNGVTIDMNPAAALVAAFGPERQRRGRPGAREPDRSAIRFSMHTERANRSASVVLLVMPGLVPGIHVLTTLP